MRYCCETTAVCIWEECECGQDLTLRVVDKRVDQPEQAAAAGWAQTLVLVQGEGVEAGHKHLVVVVDHSVEVGQRLLGRLHVWVDHHYKKKRDIDC